jgi:hypothetical protein
MTMAAAVAPVHTLMKVYRFPIHTTFPAALAPGLGLDVMPSPAAVADRPMAYRRLFVAIASLSAIRV